jgi:3'(2'), 5'-bisphosphate nucleotidase
LVAEAGGSVCDIYGKPLDFSLGRTLRANKGIIATNGLVHQAVINAARKLIPKF